MQSVQLWLEKLESQHARPMQQQSEKVEKWLRKPVTQVSIMSGCCEASAASWGTSTPFKIPMLDRTGLWKLYHKQFKAAATYNE